MLRASAFPFIMARVPNRVARFVNAISSIYACLGGGKESSLILYASIFWQFRSPSHCSPFDSQPSPCCIHHGGLLNLFCLFVDAIHTFFSCHHTQFFPLFIHILVFFYLSQQHLFCCLLHVSSTFENYWRLVFGLVYPGRLGIVHKWLRLGVIGCCPTAWSCGVTVLTQLVLYWMQLSRLIPLGVTNVQVPKVGCQFDISGATWCRETIGKTWCLSCCLTAWSWGVICYLMWLVLINVPDLWTMSFHWPCQFRRYHPST